MVSTMLIMWVGEKSECVVHKAPVYLNDRKIQTDAVMIQVDDIAPSTT